MTTHTQDFALAPNLRRANAFGKPLGSKPRTDRRGAAVVEFAVVAPIFLLLVLGMIEFGRVLMVQQMLINASREGARVAVLDGATTGDVESTVDDYLDGSSISAANVTVTPDPPSNAGFGDPVTVRVTLPFDQVSWLPSPMYLSGYMITAESVMRRETVQ